MNKNKIIITVFYHIDNKEQLLSFFISFRTLLNSNRKNLNDIEFLIFVDNKYISAIKKFIKKFEEFRRINIVIKDNKKIKKNRVDFDGYLFWIFSPLYARGKLVLALDNDTIVNYDLIGVTNDPNFQSYINGTIFLGRQSTWKNVRNWAKYVDNFVNLPEDIRGSYINTGVVFINKANFLQAVPNDAFLFDKINIYKNQLNSIDLNVTYDQEFVFYFFHKFTSNKLTEAMPDSHVTALYPIDQVVDLLSNNKPYIYHDFIMKRFYINDELYVEIEGEESFKEHFCSWAPKDEYKTSFYNVHKEIINSNIKLNKFIFDKKWNKIK